LLALRWGRVLGVGARRPGVLELDCDLGPALCYPLLTGPASAGDRVLLNVLAPERALGTGGYHIVVHVAGREAGPGAGAGRHVKLRYTPWQIPVQAAEESAPPPEGLAGMPVVAGSLHSQLGPVAVGFKQAAPEARLAYVMTDGAALPAWVSRQVADLRSLGLIDRVVTAGHAFGGDLEAVGLPSALLVARGAGGCDAAVACMGPGVSGTGTAWGHTATEQAWIVEAAAALGGRPIACPRLGWSDPRPRHRGLSHHTASALGRLALAPALVALPAGADAGPLRPLAARHALVEVEAGQAVAAARRLLAGHTSMGRGWDGEEPLFAAAVAAGVLAGLILRR
jgi:hypothetical protein